MNKKNIIGIVIALVVMLTGGYIAYRLQPKSTLGAFSNGVNVPAVSTISITQGPTCDNNLNGCTGITTQVSSGSCGVGTSTVFAVKSPFSTSGTSTVTQVEIYGTGSATTTDIVIGTSTTPALPFTAATTTLNENLMGYPGIPTTTAFYISSIGTKLNYLPVLSGAAGATYTNNASEITVGPNEYLLAFATSTYVSALTGGGTTAAQTPAPTSCTYLVEWQR